MAKGKVGRNSVPLELVKQRREYTVGLKLAGMSVPTIVKQVNAEAKTRHWGEVVQSTIEADISNYFRKNKVLKVEDYDYMEQMREALLTQVEMDIEKMAIHISSRNKAKTYYDKNGKPVRMPDWKPFEYQDALEKLHKMKMNYAELQNWNKGRQMNINITNQTNHLSLVMGKTTEELKGTDKNVISEFVSELKQLKEKIDSEDDASPIN